MTEPIRELRPEPSTDPRTTSEAVLYEIRRVIVGQDAMLERVLVALLAGGHLLLEGVPGLAKTLTIKTLADVLHGSFKRIQFTPDLVPADLVGTRIYRPDRGSFDTELGPVFCNFLLADEINRAPAKVQSALLEVMQERQVTIGPESFAVPRPFLVMATQNPIESEGTYPLPEAQVDRFMMKVVVGYPTREEEAVVVERSLRAQAEVLPILTTEGLAELQTLTRDAYVDRTTIDYAVALTAATRNRPPSAIRRSCRTSRTGQARAARSTWCTPRAPWPSSAVAATSCRPTCVSWRPTSFGTASSRASPPWPSRSPRT